jgi:hypothetical protein
MARVASMLPSQATSTVLSTCANCPLCGTISTGRAALSIT